MDSETKEVIVRVAQIVIAIATVVATAFAADSVIEEHTDTD